MSKILGAVFITLLALVSTGAIGCGERGVGKNIAQGKTCRAGSEKSTCAAGLFCEASTGRMETSNGSEYYVLGLCVPQKTIGQSCSLGKQDECAAPLKCVSDSTSTTDFLANLNGPKHCR